MEAIVYTSNTGYTHEYAQLLNGILRLPVYKLENGPEKGTSIIYLGWLKAGKVEGYKKAAQQYDIQAVCAVGLADTGSQLAEVRKSNSIPEEVALFTLQGGMDRAQLKGINKFMINMLLKGMRSKKNKTEDEERMLHLIETGGNYVSLDNLRDFLAWYKENK